MSSLSTISRTSGLYTTGKTKEFFFKLLIYAIMLVVFFVTLFPFWTCLVGSLNDGFDYQKGGLFFFPRVFTLDNYKAVLADDRILKSYVVTIFRTVIGTVLHIICTSIFAYAYSRKILKGKKFYMYFNLITLYFGGGLIPFYMLLSGLGLINSFLVYIIPGLVSFWHVIIMQTFFRDKSIESMTESALVDGANEYMIFWKIVMPLSKAILAAIALFVAVEHWNAYFDSMVFTTSSSLQTVQVFLMKLIKFGEFKAGVDSSSAQEIIDKRGANIETIKLATMMVATLPILVVYPFLQKYFVKGVMIGSLKG